MSLCSRQCDIPPKFPPRVHSTSFGPCPGGERVSSRPALPNLHRHEILLIKQPRCSIHTLPQCSRRDRKLPLLYRKAPRYRALLVSANGSLAHHHSTRWMPYRNTLNQPTASPGVLFLHQPLAKVHTPPKAKIECQVITMPSL